MRVKRTLTKNFDVKTTMEEIKAMAQEIWKMSTLYPKTSKKILSHKISKKYNEQWGVLQKELLKNWKFLLKIS